MSKPLAPSMPTPRQIQEIYRAVAEVQPGVRIVGVGPEGVTFGYGDTAPKDNAWQGQPFTPGGAK